MLKGSDDGRLVLNRLPAELADVGRAAIEVLRSNWTGSSTVPSPFLYPHQWSWDSACIAMGYSLFDQDHAETELRSLFKGQWSTGLLPHIIFNEEANYFPGPEFWQTNLAPAAPAGASTSGIVQPPVHGIAALRVYRRADDRDRAHAFLVELLPKLAAWHEYLYRERDRDGSGLIEIWHPWESGMDNTPLWDAALERIDLAVEDVPEYARVDNTIAAPEQRPTDGEYDRYAYLVKLYRDNAYDDLRIRETCPFVVQDVLFNSILVRADRDLAEIARIVGEDGSAWEQRAAETAAAVDERLWDPATQMYGDYDVRADELIGARVGGAFAPLYAQIPDATRAASTIERLDGFTVAVNGVGTAVTSVAPADPLFDSGRYWRGPVWLMINWLIHHGLNHYGYAERAAAIRSGCLELTRSGGFWEHYNPESGEGQGTGQFAWTAGLVLDLLGEESQ
jgi:hypothetical protein